MVNIMVKMAVLRKYYSIPNIFDQFIRPLDFVTM